MKALVSFTVCLVGAFERVLFEVLFAVPVVWVDLVLFPTDFFVDVEALEVEPVDAG